MQKIGTESPTQMIAKRKAARRVSGGLQYYIYTYRQRQYTSTYLAVHQYRFCLTCLQETLQYCRQRQYTSTYLAVRQYIF